MENTKNIEQKRLERLTEAMFDTSMPVNPIPFAMGLSDFIKDEGTSAIKGDRARAMLWVLMAQSYGDLATIDLCDEWRRLCKVIMEEKGMRQ